MPVSNEMRGAGGGGGGNSFRNRPDNLRSTDTFEALLGLCSGRIRGLAPGGLQNLFINDTPIEDGSGNKTLTDFNVLLCNGDPAVLAPITLQLGGSAGATSINLPISNLNAGSTSTSGPAGDWVFGNVTTPGVNFIDLRFLVSALYRQDKNGIYDATASIEIQLQPSGSGTWINPLISLTAPAYNPDGFNFGTTVKALLMRDRWDTDTTWADTAAGYVQVTGKTSQAYIKELRLAVPNDGNYANKTWSIRVRLMERETYTSDDNEERRTILWESIAGVSTAPIGGTEEWRGLAYLQVNGKASDQLTGIPKITGIYDLTECKVPPDSVWNPETRLYTGGTWDGATTQIRWTTCPAFQLKDLIEDSISGVSALVPGSTLNKWDTLEASKWFSQLVPDGKGGMHCRYSMNYLLDSAQSINDTIQNLAGAVGSYAFDEGDGHWRLIVEKPEHASALFTKENVVGEFNYSHSNLDSRFNDITAVYRNEENRFEEDRVRVFDQDHIDLFGRRTTSLVLVGCTNRQEALRRAYLRLLTSINETRQVSFTTNRQGSLIQPFNVTLIADQDLGASDQRTTGRIVYTNGTTLTVRDNVYLALGISYKIHVTVPNPAYDPDSTAQPTDPDWRKPTVTITRDITNTSSQRGSTKTLHINAALPDNTPENANIAFEAVNLPTLPKPYRVLNIEPHDDEMMSVTALELYTSKWDESDAVDETTILSQMPNKIVPPPETPTAILNSFVSNYQTKRVINVSWHRPATYWFEGFKVEYTLNGGPAITLKDNTQDSFVELQEPSDGLYTFSIYTLDRRGGISLPAVTTYTLGDVAPPGSQKLTASTSGITVTADYNGVALDGQLPVTGTARYYVGDTDVTAATTWSVTTSGCTVSIDDGGLWTVTAVAATGQFNVIGTYEGVTLTTPIAVTKNTQVATSTGGGALTSLTSFSSVNATGAYASAPTPTGVIKSSGTGTIKFSMAVSYNVSAISGTKVFRLAGKIAYRVASSGSGWTDAASEALGSDASMSVVGNHIDGYETDSETGVLTVAEFTVSGLTANTDYEFGPFFRKFSGSTSTISTPYGNVTAKT
jgi:predicted phage tail protein